APIAIAAQETASDTLLTVAHYLDWEQASEPQISPDGAQIVYTRRRVNKLEDKWESALWIMNADGSHQRFLVKGSGARWAEGGTRGTLTAGHWYVGAGFDGLSGRVGYDWTPVATPLVFDGLRDTTGDDQYRVSRVYALDVATGAIRTLVSRAGYWADPTVS